MSDYKKLREKAAREWMKLVGSPLASEYAAFERGFDAAIALMRGQSEVSEAKCELCGQPMSVGEEMFKYHGYSGPCPTRPDGDWYARKIASEPDDVMAWRVEWDEDNDGDAFYVTLDTERGAMGRANEAIAEGFKGVRVRRLVYGDTNPQDASGDAEKDAEIARLNAIINSPQSDDFLRAVSTEAEHQRQRWGSDHDAGKAPADWFWLVGYLGGKALHSHAAGDTAKAEHHIITTAAACANWHRAMFGRTDMRPGIDGQAAMQAKEAK